MLVSCNLFYRWVAHEAMASIFTIAFQNVIHKSKFVLFRKIVRCLISNFYSISTNIFLLLS